MYRKGDNKGSEEGCNSLDGEAQLLRYPLIDEVGVGRKMAGDGSGLGQVEEGNFLAYCLFEEVDPKRPCDPDGVGGGKGLGMYVSG